MRSNVYVEHCSPYLTEFSAPERFACETAGEGISFKVGLTGDSVRLTKYCAFVSKLSGAEVWCGHAFLCTFAVRLSPCCFFVDLQLYSRDRL